MSQEWFTPDSAREALERVRPVTERLCRLYRELQALSPGKVTSDQRVPPGYFERVRRMHDVLEELERLGVVIKDFGRGLVDFPARRGGREVSISWQVGEAGLGWWHEPDAGLAGRKPIDDDGLWDEPDDLAESGPEAG